MMTATTLFYTLSIKGYNGLSCMSNWMSPSEVWSIAYGRNVKRVAAARTPIELSRRVFGKLLKPP